LQNLTKVSVDDDIEVDSNLNYQKKIHGNKRHINARKPFTGSLPSDVEGDMITSQCSISWQKWSGNSAQEIPSDMRKFLKLDEDGENDVNNVGGIRGQGNFDGAPELISIPFKSTLWQQITKTGVSSSSRSATSTTGGSIGGASGHVRFSEEGGGVRVGKSPLGRDDGSIDHVEVLPIKRRCPSNRRYNTLPTTDFLTSMPVFQALSIDTLNAVARLAVEESYNKEQPVLVQGQTMSIFYILR
jgi:hypothetical protein